MGIIYASDSKKYIHENRMGTSAIIQSAHD